MTAHLLTWPFVHHLIFTEWSQAMRYSFGSILVTRSWANECVISSKWPFFPNTSSLLFSVITERPKYYPAIHLRVSRQAPTSFISIQGFYFTDIQNSGCVCGGDLQMVCCVSCSVVVAWSWPASWSVINCYFGITKWEEMLTNSYTLHWLKIALTNRATSGWVSRVDAAEAFENDYRGDGYQISLRDAGVVLVNSPSEWVTNNLFWAPRVLCCCVCDVSWLVELENDRSCCFGTCFHCLK